MDADTKHPFIPVEGKYKLLYDGKEIEHTTLEQGLNDFYRNKGTTVKALCMSKRTYSRLPTNQPLDSLVASLSLPIVVVDDDKPGISCISSMELGES